MINKELSELTKRIITSIVLLTCFGGAYLHSAQLFNLFLTSVLVLTIAFELPSLMLPNKRIISAFFGFYVISSFSVLIWLTHRYRALDFFLPLYPFFIAWTADTCGYVVGKLFGKHKICPSISPGKSWEGLAGSFVGVFCVQLLFAAHTLLFKQAQVAASVPASLGIALIMTTVSFLGGFLLSYIKRKNGLKDTGRLLPGHGGLLDRFDSVIATAMATGIMILIIK